MTFHQLPILGSQNRRPTLHANGHLIKDFMAATRPCCALGILGDGNRSTPFVALRPGEPILPQPASSPLHHGHALLGAPQSEVLQFGFTFFERSTFHVLVNPNNGIVRSVLSHIIERSHYFVFAADLDENLTAFRADIRPAGLARFSFYQRRARSSATTADQYDEVLAQFRRNPAPPGAVLEWVCRENVEYLDFTRNRLSVSPGVAPR